MAIPLRRVLSYTHTHRERMASRARRDREVRRAARVIRARSASGDGRAIVVTRVTRAYPDWTHRARWGWMDYPCPDVVGVRRKW